MRKVLFLFSFVLGLIPVDLLAIGHTRYVETTSGPGSFPIVGPLGASPIYVDAADWPGVVRAVSDLQSDINRVTEVTPSQSQTKQCYP